MMQVFELIAIFDTISPLKTIHNRINYYTDLLQGYCSQKKVITEDMGVKNLAYEIRNHKQGYYVLFTFASPFENIQELERRLRIDENVLKFMVVKKENEAYNDLPDYNVESEQKQIDAMDVLLGLAEYKKKGV